MVPFKIHKYGPASSTAPAPPKMILLTGSPDSIREKSLCSALVNELRRGNLRKRSDIHYNTRDEDYVEASDQEDDESLEYDSSDGSD